MEFKKLYQKRYDLLIFGYIKELENDNIVANIPIVSKKIDFKLYPLI